MLPGAGTPGAAMALHTGPTARIEPGPSEAGYEQVQIAQQEIEEVAAEAQPFPDKEVLREGRLLLAGQGSPSDFATMGDAGFGTKENGATGLLDPATEVEFLAIEEIVIIEPSDLSSLVAPGEKKRTLNGVGRMGDTLLPGGRLRKFFGKSCRGEAPQEGSGQWLVGQGGQRPGPAGLRIGTSLKGTVSITMSAADHMDWGWPFSGGGQTGFEGFILESGIGVEQQDPFMLRDLQPEIYGCGKPGIIRCGPPENLREFIQHSFACIRIPLVVDDDKLKNEVGAFGAHAAQGTEDFVGVLIVHEDDADRTHGRHEGHLAGRGWPAAKRSEFHQTPAPQQRWMVGKIISSRPR